MSAAGIAPDANRPPGVTDEGFGRRDDFGQDLSRMLAPLCVIPGLVGLAAIERRLALGESIDSEVPIAVALEMELDPRAPHLDFARQLLRHLRRLVAQRGFVLRRDHLNLLAEITALALR
jgi:hypothetical protein